MTTRSARGTAASMRRLAISRMRSFCLALTSLLPSTSFISSLTSFTLMRSRRNSMCFCSGTSTSAKAASRPTISSSPPSISCPPAASAAGSGIASNSAWRGHWRASQKAPRPPISSASRQALSVCTSCWPENMRLKPAIGSNFSSLGSIALRLKFQPPARMPLAAASSTTPASSGRITTATGSTSASSRSSMRSGSPTSVASKRRPAAMRSDSQPVSAGAKTASAPMPAPSAAKCARSRERATWPSRRDFWILRCDAGRFLSWAESAMANEMGSLEEPCHGADAPARLECDKRA